MVDVSSPSNQIYEDLTPNTTPRSQTSREAESIERQVSPAAEEKSPTRLINRGVKRLREIYGEEFIYPDNEEISDERDADIFFESEDAVLNTINSERETTENSDDDDGGDERAFTPVFNATDQKLAKFMCHNVRTADKFYVTNLIAKQAIDHHRLFETSLQGAERSPSTIQNPRKRKRTLRKTPHQIPPRT
ncbi:unnamed protein product [Leuciscus chuanchicus]